MTVTSDDIQRTSNEQLIAVEMRPRSGCWELVVTFNRQFDHVEMNAMHRALNEHLISHAPGTEALQEFVKDLSRQHCSHGGDKNAPAWPCIPCAARTVLGETNALKAPVRHSRTCDCYECHYSKQHPQVKPHHPLCGCFECSKCLHGNKADCRECRLEVIKQTPRQASIDDIEWLCEEVERLSGTPEHPSTAALRKIAQLPEPGYDSSNARIMRRIAEEALSAADRSAS
jgi:hypothetical protein